MKYAMLFLVFLYSNSFAETNAVEVWIPEIRTTAKPIWQAQKRHQEEWLKKKSEQQLNNGNNYKNHNSFECR